MCQYLSRMKFFYRLNCVLSQKLWKRTITPSHRHNRISHFLVDPSIFLLVGPTHPSAAIRVVSILNSLTHLGADPASELRDFGEDSWFSVAFSGTERNDTDDGSTTSKRTTRITLKWRYFIKDCVGRYSWAPLGIEKNHALYWSYLGANMRNN